MMISIIIPVYNIEKWLGECLGSIAAQEWGEWEAICVDDGSSDGSAAILDEWGKKDERFRVFHKENGGVASARNFGIEQAKGEYLWFVDGDDVVPAGALGLVAKAIENAGGCDILMLNCRRFRDGSACEFKVNAKNDSIRIDNLMACEQLDRFAFYADGLVAWNGVYRREKYGMQRFRGYRNGEDSLWGFEALVSAEKIAYLDEPVYAYRNRAESATNTDYTAQLKSHFDVACEMMELAKEKGLSLAYIGETERLMRKKAMGTCAWMANRIGRRGVGIWREGAERLFGEKIEMGDARLWATVILPGWVKFEILHLPGVMTVWRGVRKVFGG